MATRTATRRHHSRITVPNGSMTVAFADPTVSGGETELAVVDLSGAGFSFRALGDEQPRLDVGTTVAGVELRLGGVIIQGELVVMHVTPGAGSDTTYGALFYPAGDPDLIKLKSVVAGMQAVGGD